MHLTNILFCVCSHCTTYCNLYTVSHLFEQLWHFIIWHFTLQSPQGKSLTVHCRFPNFERPYLYFSGVQQSLPGTDSPLAVLHSSKGLNRINLLPPIEIGIWQLTVKTIGPMTFNVLGKNA